METSSKNIALQFNVIFFPLKTDDCGVVLVAGDLEPSD